MKIMTRIVVAMILFVAGFAAGFPIGERTGFATGGEWAIVQADILARESGMFMPVAFEDGRFRVMLKQPRHLYKQAWQLADRHDDVMMQCAYQDAEFPTETVQLAQNTHSVQ